MQVTAVKHHFFPNVKRENHIYVFIRCPLSLAKKKKKIIQFVIFSNEEKHQEKNINMSDPYRYEATEEHPRNRKLANDLIYI